MDTVADILGSAPSAIDDTVPDCTESALDACEAALGCSLPEDYRAFCLLGGLKEMRLKERVLSPDELVAASNKVSSSLVPFADNGCGDLYCWQSAELPGSAVVFLDHETGNAQQFSKSFLSCLRAWRF